MPSSILNETKNLIRLYRHHCGRTEVPSDYHLWASLTLISAAVADRVWFRKFADSKLNPNLYVILLGPSGTGKGNAINSVMKFVRDVPKINSYRGKSTAPYLVDYLSKGHRTEGKKWVLENSKLFLVTPELSMAVGSGTLADGFIKLLTELYEGGDYLFQEGTRVKGGVEFRDPVINWLGGTTKEWLMTCVTRDAVEGGFFARTCVVAGDYDPQLRIVEPEYPDDRDEVVEYLKGRVQELCYVGGEFTMSEHARNINREWYNGRESPGDETLLPSWKRQHDLVLKLAMILSLAEEDLSLRIEAHHISQAQNLIGKLHKSMPSLVELASTTRDTEGLERVKRLIEKNGKIPRYVLMQRVSKYGLSRDKLDVILGSLNTSKEIETAKNKNGGVEYSWKNGKRMIRFEDIADELTDE